MKKNFQAKKSVHNGKETVHLKISQIAIYIIYVFFFFFPNVEIH